MNDRKYKEYMIALHSQKEKLRIMHDKLSQNKCCLMKEADKNSVKND